MNFLSDLFNWNFIMHCPRFCRYGKQSNQEGVVRPACIRRKTNLFRTITMLLILWISIPLYGQDNLRNIPNPNPEYQLSTLVPAEGFQVNLFASEPMVEKPIQMNWDEKGRLWVVGTNQYPQPKPGEMPTGKVFVLEDTDGDGHADKSTVFADDLLVPTAILPGDGGVYVANSTEILHLKDTNGDGKYDKRKVLLSGFGTGDTHHLIHTFRWGPEGSLFFNQSIYIYSHIETPHGLRTLEGGGVWRFRPQTLELDVFAHGLINPWGLEFNKWGQSFLTDGAGSEGINYAFQGATFATAPGAERIIRGLSPGQPKHSGLDIISGRHLPETWSGHMITNDFRANRVNRFSLERLGSGYVSTQEEDLVYSDNVAFRPVDISVGPDGAIYVADWYNPIIQHGEVDFRDPRRDRENGRIWRISRKNHPSLPIPDLNEAGNTDLLNHLKSPESWTRSQAKRILKERGLSEILVDLDRWTAALDQKDPQYERWLLEAFWVYQSLDKTNNAVLKKLLEAVNPMVRAAAVRALFYDFDNYPGADMYLRKRISDRDPLVRLETVIALRNSSSPKAAAIATKALEHEMDQNLDFALWQTIRELESEWMEAFEKDVDYFGSDQKAVYALKSVKNPRAVKELLKLYLNGRITERDRRDVYTSWSKYGEPKELDEIFRLSLNSVHEHQDAYLQVLIDAMKQRAVKPHGNLTDIRELFDEPDNSIARKAITLAGLWKMKDFVHSFKVWAKQSDAANRSAGLTALANLGGSESLSILESFTDADNTLELRMEAIEKLVSMDIGIAAERAWDLFSELENKEHVSRLFVAFYGNKMGPTALYQVLKDKDIPPLVAKTGLEQIIRMPERKKKQDEMEALMNIMQITNIKLEEPTMPQNLSEWDKDRLELDIKAYGDPKRGELVYRDLNCMSCHAIGGAGGKIGTDLSSLGANAPVDYIISSILTPGNEIKDGYELNQIIRKNGNVIMGYMLRETTSEVVLRDIIGNEVVIPKFQIDTHKNIPGSLMPPGLTSGLTRDEFVDLVGFLSKIGKPGDFRVPTDKYIRYWEVLDAGDEDVEEIANKGVSIVLDEADSYLWKTVYSTVSGTLPAEDVPSIGDQSIQVIRFSIDVLRGGDVTLVFDTKETSAWVDRKSVKLEKDGLHIELEAGTHQVTLVRKGQVSESELSVMISENSDTAARVQPVHSE